MYLIKAEFIKLHRCNIMWVGMITLLCSPLLAVLQQQSLNEPIENYGYLNLVNTTIWNNMGLFLPVTLMMLGGYMINREYTDHTLKELFVVPISYQKLMIGKMGALFIVSLIYSFYSFLLTLFLSTLFFPIGLTGAEIAKSLFQICGMGICICISIMPFMCWSGASKNRFWVGTVLAFLYGFFGIPIAGHGLQDYYPVSAGLSIIQYGGDTGSLETYFHPQTSIIVLSITLCLSILVLCIQNKKK